MSVQDTDILLYLTGAPSDGGDQTDPDVSLGNYRSSSEIASGGANTLFDDVLSQESALGDIEYRCYCIKNINVVDDLLNPKIWIETDTGNNEDNISFAVEVPAGGDQDGNAQTITNESSSPVVGAGNVSAWSDSISKATGTGVDQGGHDANLDAGEIVFVWVRRTISAGASAVSTENLTIKIEGDN